MNSPEAARSELVTYAQLGKAWGVSPKTIQNWVSADRAAGYVIPTTGRCGRRRAQLRLSDALGLFDRHIAPHFVF